MKKVFKIIRIILIVIIGIFALFITEESIRLKFNNGSKPLIVLGRTKYCISCLEPGEEINFEYFSTPPSAKSIDCISTSLRKIQRYLTLREKIVSSQCTSKQQ